MKHDITGLSLHLMDKEKFKNFIDKSDKASTVQFFRLVNALAKEGESIPNHWIIALTEMLIEASDTRTTNKIDPMASALHISNVNNQRRDLALAKVIGFYFSFSGKQNESCKKTNKLLKKYGRKTYGITTLKNIWYENEKYCLVDKTVFKNMEEFYPDLMILTEMPPD